MKILRDSLLPQDPPGARAARSPTGKLVDDKGKVLLEKGVELDDAALERRAAQVLGRDPGRERRRRGRAAAARSRGDGARARGALPREDRAPEPRGRAAAGRHQDGEGLRRHQAQAPGRRQDGRSPRQQGCRQPHPARGGHAVPGGRHARRHRAEPARRAEPHERRSDPRDAPRLGRARSLGRADRRMLSTQQFGADRVRAAAAGDLRGRRGLRPSCVKSLPDGGRVRAGRQAPARRVLRHRRCSTARARTQIKERAPARGLPHSGQADPVRRPHAASRSTRTSPWASCTC